MKLDSWTESLLQLLGTPRGLACLLDFFGDSITVREGCAVSALGMPPLLPKQCKALGCLPSAKVGRNWTADLTYHGAGRQKTKRGFLYDLSNQHLPPSVLTCCAVVSFRFGFRLEGEAFDEAVGEAAGFLLAGRTSGDIGQVIMRLAQASFFLLGLSPEDELGTTPKKTNCKDREEGDGNNDGILPWQVSGATNAPNTRGRDLFCLSSKSIQQGSKSQLPASRQSLHSGQTATPASCFTKHCTCPVCKLPFVQQHPHLSGVVENRINRGRTGWKC